MKVLLRNMTSSAQLVDFTGFNVQPQGIIIQANRSAIVETPLSAVQFRNIPYIVSAISANDIDYSISGGVTSIK